MEQMATVFAPLTPGEERLSIGVLMAEGDPLLATTTELSGEALVVVVGASRAVERAARVAAISVAAASMRACSVKDAATTVATHRPFAIIVPDELYQFDPSEFDALARDVSAKVIQVPAALRSTEKLVELLMVDIRDAHTASITST